MGFHHVLVVWLTVSCSILAAPSRSSYLPNASSRTHKISVVPSKPTGSTTQKTLRFEESEYLIASAAPLRDTGCHVDIDLVNIRSQSTAEHLPYTKRLPGTRLAIHTQNGGLAESSSTSCFEQAAIVLRMAAEQAGLSCIAASLDAGLAQIPASFAAFDAKAIRRDGCLGQEDAGTLLRWSSSGQPNMTSQSWQSIMLDMEWQCPPDDCVIEACPWLVRHISLALVASDAIQWRELVVSVAVEDEELAMSHGEQSLLPLIKRSHVFGSIRRKSMNTGLHREVVYDVVVTSESLLPQRSCALLLLQHVDATTYVDLDELRASVRHKPGVDFHAFTKHIDVEKPASLSSQHILVLKWPMIGVVEPTSQHISFHATAEFLMHMRYQSVGCGAASGHFGAKPREWLRVMRRRYPTMLDDGSIQYPITNTSTEMQRDDDPFIAGCYAQPYLPQPVVHLECTNAPGNIVVVDLNAGWTVWSDRYGFDAALTPELPLTPVGHRRHSSLVGWFTTLAALTGSAILSALAVKATRRATGEKAV
jgi:hypothetical protein